jgi:hypothetical protein
LNPRLLIFDTPAIKLTDFGAVGSSVVEPAN